MGKFPDTLGNGITVTFALLKNSKDDGGGGSGIQFLADFH